MHSLLKNEYVAFFFLLRNVYHIYAFRYIQTGCFILLCFAFLLLLLFVFFLNHRIIGIKLNKKKKNRDVRQFDHNSKDLQQFQHNQKTIFRNNVIVEKLSSVSSVCFWNYGLFTAFASWLHLPDILGILKRTGQNKTKSSISLMCRC